MSARCTQLRRGAKRFRLHAVLGVESAYPISIRVFRIVEVMVTYCKLRDRSVEAEVAKWRR